MSDLILEPRNPKEPMSIVQLKSYFQKDYLKHDFNFEANQAVSAWFSKLENETPKSLVVNGYCGNGKTHLIFHHLVSYKTKSPMVNIYWWQAEQVINRKHDLGNPVKPSLFFLETVLNNSAFKGATDFVVKFCVERNIPLIISDASSEMVKNINNVDYVKINTPSNEFYKLFAKEFRKNYPAINFRQLSNFVSVRHLENELRRDVIAYELSVKVKS